MNRHEIKIVLLRGAPGVGKSTLAKGLRAFFPDGIVLETDAIHQFINSVDWNDDNEKEACLENALAMADVYLEHGYKPCIIVSPFYKRWLDFFLDQLRKHHHAHEHFVISLYADDEVLKQRVAQRENGYSNLELCLEYNEDTRTYRVENELLIDTSHFSDAELVEFVHKKLEEIL
jgi:predicted kinase